MNRTPEQLIDQNQSNFKLCQETSTSFLFLFGVVSEVQLAELWPQHGHTICIIHSCLDPSLASLCYLHIYTVMLMI